MRLFRLVVGLILISILGLIACQTQTPPPAPPAPTGAGVLTDPATATAEAAAAAALAAPSPTLVITPSPEPDATVAAEPTASLVVEPTITPTVELTATPTLTPTVVAQPTAIPSPTPAPLPQVTVNESSTSAINVRAGPGTNYPVVGQLQPGQTAAVTGRNQDTSWWQISLTGAGTAETPGWVYGELVTLTGDSAAIAVAAAPPPPTPAPQPTPPPAPPAGEEQQEAAPSSEELADSLRCGKDFCVTYQAMVPIWENGGCKGNHSIYITVLEGPPPGRPMDGVVIGDTFNNVEVASGDKGPGVAEITLWMNSMSVRVKRHINGTPYTSEESYSFTSHDEQIPAEVLAANGYCDGSVDKCRAAQQQNQVCRGHYSWRVTFHKFD
jgi:hypothetical protein